MRARYPTDLTDAEWEIVRGYIPEPVWFPNLQEPKYSRRDIVDAIFYRERTGCQWRNLPHDFPPGKQVFDYFRKWRDDGTLEALHEALRKRVREQTPRADGTSRSDAPKVCIVDSQSAKTSEEGELERGYDAGKKIKGRKRHLVVDALGLLLVLHVTSASVQDRDAALAMVQESKREFPSLEVVFMDGAYRGEVKTSIEDTTGMQVKIALRSDPQKKGSSPSPCDGSSSEPSDG
ncbi:MAG: IS5 family transposase [Polyangiaceae bacterium]|nr:IS5 family transposase [Polyangiaceae bacterium]